MKFITVVIPAFNEEKTIESTIRAVQKLDYINKIMVVDDGSTDQTARIAREAGADVLALTPNRGKGGAMNAAAEHIKTDIIAFVDADLGQCAEQVELILQPIIDQEADLAIAAFPPAKRKGGFGLVKNTARRAIKKAGQIEVVSPLSGQRAMKIEVLRAEMPFQQAYGVELGMTLKALRKGYKVIEVPTTMTHNETGRDLQGFLHRGRQFVDVLKVIRAESRGE